MEPTDLIIAYTTLAVVAFVVTILAKGLTAEDLETQGAREGRERLKRIRNRTAEVIQLGPELIDDICNRDRLIKVYNDFDGPVADAIHAAFMKILSEEFLVNTSQRQKCARVLSLLRLIEGNWERHEHTPSTDLAIEVAKNIQNFMDAILEREKVVEFPAH